MCDNGIALVFRKGFPANICDEDRIGYWVMLPNKKVINAVIHRSGGQIYWMDVRSGEVFTKEEILGYYRP